VTAAYFRLILSILVILFDSSTRTEAQAPDVKQQCLNAYSESQELRLQGSLLAARERLLLCSRDSCPRLIVNDCARWLPEVEDGLSSVVLAPSDAEGHDLSEVRVRAGTRTITEHTDGRAVSLDPGPYNFTFEAPGYQPAQVEVTLRQSEKNRIVRVQLDKEVLSPLAAANMAAPEVAAAPLQPGADRAESKPQLTRSWPVATTVLTGVALAGVGTFAYFGLNGVSKREDAERCSMNCGELIDGGKRDYIVADIGLGVAIAAAVSAVLVYTLVESKPHPQPRSNSAGQP